MLIILLGVARSSSAQVESVLNPPGATYVESISAAGRNTPVFGDPSYYWFQRGRCMNSGETPGLPDAPAHISRIAAYRSPVRRLVTRTQGASCSTDIYNVHSNIAVDGQHLWFFDSRFPGFVTLERLSRNATPEAPDFQEFDPFGSFGHTPPHEVEVSGAYVYYVYRTNESHILYRIAKDGQSPRAEILASTPQEAIFDLQWDGIYLWFLVNPGPTLVAYEEATGELLPVDSGITAYQAEFSIDEQVQSGGIRRYTFMHIAVGNTIYSGDLQTDIPLVYTSPDPDARIYEIVTDRTSLFFFESRPIPGDLSRRHLLFRKPLSTGDPPLLISGVGGVRTIEYENLTTDESFLYWTDPLVQDLFRTPVTAGAPLVNLRATGLDVIQAVQNGPGDVPLIAGKRTFVRLYAQADGADVPDVQARLIVFRNGQQHVISPSLGASAAGGPSTRITVKANPRRFSLGDSFTFELPDELTQPGVIAIQGTVNPLGSQLEPGATPLADNSFTRTPIEFLSSPRLPLIVVNYEYQFGPTLVQTSAADANASLAYVRRTYPLASSPGDLTDGSAGLRVRQITIRDDEMAARVARTHKDCEALKDADKNQCAGNYAVARTRALAMARTIPDLPFAYYYSNIPQADEVNLFTRGFMRSRQEICGPIGPGSNDTYLTYAAHEVGHALGRAHPAAGIGCGHSDSDRDYPYVSAYFAKFENPESLQYYALDSGDPAVPIPFSLYTWDQRYDFMSYCEQRWVSDYTYRGMLNRLNGSGGAPMAIEGHSAGIAGDWLFVAGFVTPEENVSLSVIERLPDVAEVPSIPPGDYTLELIDGDGTLLLSQSFAMTPSSDSEPGAGGFALVVPFEPGTRQIRIRQAGNPSVEASVAVSRTAPVVEDVRLVGATEPLDGGVTVAWAARDDDRDTLRFDLLYSPGGDEPYRAVHLGIENTTVQVDTTRLGGGNGRFRIVASDGVNTGHADSATFAVAVKPPQPRILSPADGAVVAWGSTVTLEGEASDAQDGYVTEGSLSWANQYGLLGGGGRVSVTDLPVGLNTILLEATNSRDGTAGTSITINVVDTLTPTSPTLSIDPAELSFHVDAGSDAIVEKNLEIGNFGSGNLRFTATTDGTPWLSFTGETSVTTTTPRLLAIWADPTGLSADTTYVARVTITPSGQPQNARTITVRLSIGNVHDTAGQGTLRGDANCDGRVGAADLPAMLRNLATGERSACGEDDINADLALDENDLALLPGAIFGSR